MPTLQEAAKTRTQKDNLIITETKEASQGEVLAVYRDIHVKNSTF